MSVQVRPRGIIQILAIAGPPSTADAREIHDAVNRSIESGAPFLVFDLRSRGELDSTCLGELVACRERVRRHGGALKIVASDRGRDLLAVSGLDRLFEVHEDEEQALDSFLPADVTAGVP